MWFHIGLLLLILGGAGDLWAAGRLLEIDKDEDFSVTRLHLNLTEVPGYRIKTSGQRIDLFLDGVNADPSLGSFPEDGTLVKVLLARHRGELMVSFLMRAVPQQVNVLTLEGSSRLTLEVVWSKRSVSRPAISNYVKGAPSLRPDGKSFRRLGRSSYADNWKGFFADYEPPFSLEVPLRFTLPALPELIYEPMNPAAAGQALKQALQQGQGGDWAGALEVFRGIGADQLTGIDRQALLIFHGEALARTGNHGRARKVFDQFMNDFPDSALRNRGRYLLAYVRAAADEPFEANYELALLRQSIGDKRPYGVLAKLLQAELDLVTGRSSQAFESLKVLDPQVSGALGRAVSLRTADALAALGQDRQALDLYASLGDFLQARPWSLARYGENLYRNKDYPAAARSFSSLAELVSGQGEVEALVQVAVARAQLRSGRAEEAWPRLGAVDEGFARTHAQYRGALIRADHGVVAGGLLDWQSALAEYDRIAELQTSRELREEAAFKQVLLRYLMGYEHESLEGVQGFIRNYGSGPLREQADALLGQLLPAAIKALIKDDQNLQALVLIEQNRSLLLAASMGQGFLLDLGQALEGMGLLEKAAKVYSYMLDAYGGAAGGTDYYLPLARVRYEQQKYSQTAELAEQYLALFPQGEQRTELFCLQVEALYADGRVDECAKKLTHGERPEDQGLDLLAGKVFWELGRYSEVARSLGRYLESVDAGGAQGTVVLRAEALYRIDEITAALELFAPLIESEEFSDQALFRCAQIHLRQGQQEQALKLLRRLAEKGSTSRWQQAGLEFMQTEALRGS